MYLVCKINSNLATPIWCISLRWVMGHEKIQKLNKKLDALKNKSAIVLSELCILTDSSSMGSQDHVVTTFTQSRVSCGAPWAILTIPPTTKL